MEKENDQIKTHWIFSLLKGRSLAAYIRLLEIKAKLLSRLSKKKKTAINVNFNY